jgi:hypothetical protein
VRRKPASRVATQRASENDPRHLLEPLPSEAARRLLAGRVRLVPYAKHKKNPDAFGLKPYEGEHEDPSYCDEHAGFKFEDMARAPQLLKRGILAGLWGDKRKKGDPSLLWSVDDNGWIYEAAATNPGYGWYHAYPVLETEAVARRVLARYVEYVSDQEDPVLQQSLILANGRYR